MSYNNDRIDAKGTDGDAMWFNFCFILCTIAIVECFNWLTKHRRESVQNTTTNYYKTIDCYLNAK